MFVPIVTGIDIDAVKRLSKVGRDDLMQRIKSADPHFIFQSAGESRDPDKRKIICPNCGNGTGDDATPVEVTRQGDTWLYHCFKGNDLEGDLLKIIANEEHLNLNKFDDLCRVLAIGARLTNCTVAEINYSTNSANGEKKFSPSKKNNEPNKELLKLVHADIEQAQIHLVDLPKEQMRGLTLKTMNHFGFGYLAQWTHPNSRIAGKTVPASRRIIIPTPNHYDAVSLPADRSNIGKKFWKMHAAPMELFNAPALFSNADFVLVTEGEIDAASLWQAFEGKIAVVATLGVANWRKTLLPRLDGVSDKKFLILFDSEEDSRKQAENLRGNLINRGLPAVSRFFYDALIKRLETGDKNLFPFDVKVDANQILQIKDEYFLRTLTEDIIEDARADFETAEKKISQSRETAAPMNDRNISNEDFNGEDYIRGLTEDLDNARRFTKFCCERVKWVFDTERWLVWNKKGVWQRCSEKNSCLASEISSFADLMMRYAAHLDQEARRLGEDYLKASTEKTGTLSIVRVKTDDDPALKDAKEKLDRATDKSKKAFNIAYDFRKVNKVSSAITMMKGENSILITSDDLDKHANLLNCLNGVVDLQTGKFYQHDSSLLLTQQCRAAYFANAQSDLVDNFFKAIQPDEMTRAGLLRWLGYCLTGEVKEEKFMVWTGGGGNGKGVLSATTLELLGSYGIGLAPTALLKSNRPYDADKATTALNGLELARFAISEEMPADGEFELSLIKNLSGGDRINLRRLHEEYRTIRPTAKLNLSGNYTPKIENVHDDGLLRRMLNMPYLVKFGTPENPADPDLKKKLLLPENQNAFLRLLVANSVAWYRDGLIISPLMQQETKRHLEQNDFISDFISDNYERGNNLSVKAKDFVDALRREYPRECGRFKRNDLIKLISETSGITYGVNRTNNRIFRGIGKIGAPKQQGIDFDGETVTEKDAMPFDPNDMPFDN